MQLSSTPVLLLVALLLTTLPDAAHASNGISVQEKLAQLRKENSDSNHFKGNAETLYYDYYYDPAPSPFSAKSRGFMKADRATAAKVNAMRAAGDESYRTMKMNITKPADDGTVTVTGINAVGYVAIQPALASRGWDNVRVEIYDSFTELFPDLTWFALGYMEGESTSLAIYQVNVSNYIDIDSGTRDFLEEHIAYMNSTAIAMKKLYASDSYKARPKTQEETIGEKFWTQVYNQIQMLDGITFGAAALSFFDIFMLNYSDEISDAIAAVMYGGQGSYSTKNKTNGDRKTTTGVKARSARSAHLANLGLSRKAQNQHCSSLVKITDEEAYFGHDTWDDFLLWVGRQYKSYVIKGTTVSMTTSAGFMNSGDDYYLTSHGLGVMETTTGVYNNDLYVMVTPESVSEFMRIMVATFVATSTTEWVALYSIQNSGTYNNQWMVFDFNKYENGMTPAELPDDTFWVLEQIPGLIHAEDQTPMLREKTYWSSYNVPYYQNIRDISGFTRLTEEEGDFWSYWKTPRALIFARNQSQLTDLASVQALMRYNDWENDPLSTIQNCTGCVPARSPMLALSSRNDLVAADSSFGNLGPMTASSLAGPFDFGATDSKLTSATLFNAGLITTLQDGPTHNQQPLFSWRENSIANLAWDTATLPGMIQNVDFTWQFVTPLPSMSEDLVSPSTNSKSTKDKKAPQQHDESCFVAKLRNKFMPLMTDTRRTLTTKPKLVIALVSVATGVALMGLVTLFVNRRRQRQLAEQEGYDDMTY